MECELVRETEVTKNSRSRANSTTTNPTIPDLELNNGTHS
jgi:hypothetical protein